MPASAAVRQGECLGKRSLFDWFVLSIALSTSLLFSFPAIAARPRIGAVATLKFGKIATNVDAALSLVRIAAITADRDRCRCSYLAYVVAGHTSEHVIKIKRAERSSLTLE